MSGLPQERLDAQINDTKSVRGPAVQGAIQVKDYTLDHATNMSWTDTTLLNSTPKSSDLNPMTDYKSNFSLITKQIIANNFTSGSVIYSKFIKFSDYVKLLDRDVISRRYFHGSLELEFYFYGNQAHNGSVLVCADFNSRNLNMYDTLLDNSNYTNYSANLGLKDIDLLRWHQCLPRVEVMLDCQSRVKVNIPWIEPTSLPVNSVFMKRDVCNIVVLGYMPQSLLVLENIAPPAPVVFDVHARLHASVSVRNYTTELSL